MGNRPEPSTWNAQVAASVHRWLTHPDTSYFDYRREFSSFDLGLGYLLYGQFGYFLKKLGTLGRPHLEVPYADDEAPSKANSVAIIVTYNPDEAVFSNLKRAITTFGQVVIVDNSPAFPTGAFARHGISASENLTLLENRNRQGLGGAINKGIRAVHTLRRAGWVFWFDQDSLIHEGFLEKLGPIVSAEPALARNNALFGINYEDGHTPPRRTKRMIVPVDTLITSGSFTRVENLARAGLYVEELFIDSLDHEYCLRCRRVGMSVNWISEPLMRHSLGRLELRTLLWKDDVIVTNHPPFRWYYFSRNLIITLVEGFPTSLPWAIRHGWSLFKNFIKAMILEQAKGQKAYQFLKGLGAGALFCLHPRKARGQAT